MIDLIGHRGFPSMYPENTILSFKKAIENGCIGLEMDLRLSKDNEAVIIHDDTLDRTTNGKGRVKDYTLKELQKLDAGMGERIPSLFEILKILGNTRLFLELKALEEDMYRLCEISVQLVAKEKALERTVFVSFSLDALQKIKNMDPDTKTGLIFSKPWPPINNLEPLLKYIDLICPRKDRLDKDVSNFTKQNKLDLYVWTIDTEEDLEKTRRFCVKGVVSNNPGRLKSLITN